MTNPTTLPFVSVSGLSSTAFMAGNGMLTSPAAWTAVNSPEVSYTPVFVSLAHFTARDIFRFPQLIAQVEEIERECHRAKDVWMRGALALWLLAESDRLGEYVSAEGLLTDAGRAFLESDTSALRKALIERKVAEAMTQKEEPANPPTPAKEPPAPLSPSAPPVAEKVDPELDRWRMRLQTVRPSILADEVTDNASLAIVARLAWDKNIEVSVFAGPLLSEALKRHPALIPSVRVIAADLDPTAANALSQAAVEAARSAIRQPVFAVDAYMFLLEEMSAPLDGRAGARSDTSGASWNATEIISWSRNDSALRPLLLRALESAAAHTSPHVRETAEKLIRSLAETVTLGMERELFMPPRETGSFYGYERRGVDFENGPRRLADMLTDAPWLVRYAAELLGKRDFDTKKGAAMALALVAERIDIAPALQHLAKQLHLKIIDRRLNERRIDTTPFRNALEAASRHAGTRELALRLLATHDMEEVIEIMNPPAAREETKRVEPQTPPPATMEEIQALVRDLNSWDRRRVAASLKGLLNQRGPAAVAVLQVLVDNLGTMRRANIKTAAELFAAASARVDAPPGTFFDELLPLLQESSAEEWIERAFVNWAQRSNTGPRAFAAIAKGAASDEIIFRGKVCALMGRLLASTNVHRDAAATLKTWTASHDPILRASAATAMGKAFQHRHRPSNDERDLLDRLRLDRDPAVRSKAQWAFTQLRSF